MGAAVNLAARLQSAAREGQILIGPATRSHVHQAFDLEPVILEVKGVEEPVDAYLAERLLDHPAKVRGIEGLKAEMVGRRKELAALATAAQEAGGRFVALVGEAGTGKSRLAGEFQRKFESEGGRWLEGRCQELTLQTGYGPIREILRRSLQTPESPKSHTGRLRESVERLTAMGRLSSDWMDDVAPFLCVLADDSYTDPRIEQANPAQRKAMTATAIFDYLVAVSEGQPTVVFLDDLQWADQLTADLLLGLMPRLEASPVLLLGSYRPDPGSPAESFAARASADGSLSFEVLPVQALRQEEAREMVESLLGMKTLPGPLEGLLLHRAEGNPLFLEELIRSLIQKGTLQRTRDGWTLTGEISEMEVPDTLQALVLSRVDRFDLPVRRCAQVASVLGRSFRQSLVETLVGCDLGEELDVLVEAGILRPERTHPDRTFVFGHRITLEAVYETLLPSRRSTLHELVARTLEARSPLELETLAHHYDRSRNHTKAVEYLLAAGEKAMEAFLTDAALAHIDRGLERARELDTETDRQEWTARFRARRGEMLERMGRHGEARSELFRSLALGRHDTLEASRLHRLAGQTLRLEGAYEEAHAAYDRAEAALDSSPQRMSTPFHRAWIEVQKERAFALYFGGRARDLPEHNARTGPIVDRYGSGPQQVDRLIGGLLSNFRQHRFMIPHRVVVQARKAVEMATATSDLGRMAEVRFVLGFALLWADQVEESEAWMSRALNDARRIGDAVLENRAVSYHATCLRRLQRLEDAVVASTSALATAQALGDRHYEGHALANLCWGKWRGGDSDEAGRLGRDAYGAWGSRDDEGGRGLETEFAFLAVWPMVAMALEDSNLPEARSHLAYLQAPWERAMRPDLLEAVARAVQGDSKAQALEEALRLARDCLLA